MRTRVFTVPATWRLVYSYNCIANPKVPLPFYNHGKIAVVPVQPRGLPEPLMTGNGKNDYTGSGSTTFGHKPGRFYLIVKMNCTPWRVRVLTP